MSKSLFAGIEAGGTKFNCMVGYSPSEILTRLTIPTTTPEETLSKSLNFLKSVASQYGAIEALGIGSFGPVDLDPCSAQYGNITTTPKKGWKNTAIVSYFKEQLKIPICFDTDVNAAALAEQRLGAGKGLTNFVYFTIGTGIGAGVIVKEELINPFQPPELGHMQLPRHQNDDYEGCCPYHKDCLEGLASGSAIKQRWGINAPDLPEKHFAWTLQTDYLAKMCVNTACSFAPQKIILGGGVMAQRHLFPRIRERFLHLINHYMPSVGPHNIVQYIVPPELERSGEIGAFLLAMSAKPVE